MRELIAHINENYPDLHKTYSTSGEWINLTFPDMHLAQFKGNEIYKLDFKQKLAVLWLEHNRKSDAAIRKYARNDYRAICF